MKAEENLGAASGGAALVKAYIGVGSPACQHLVTKKAVVLVPLPAIAEVCHRWPYS
jgi:hypothetical protein